MSVLAKYLHKEHELKQLQAELEALKTDDRLQAEIEFKNRVEALMIEYGKTKRDVITLLSPENLTTKGSIKSDNDGRKKRKLKVYKNPHTGEIIETRGGNHKGLKAWKEQYGDKAVNTWIESEHE
ncbi:histone-like nucleoid-structuring protein, MvaT/MvaU family [Vreelandella aquamarina]